MATLGKHWHLREDQIRRDENHPMFGKHHTKEARQLMSENGKGKPAWNRGLTKETDPRVAKCVSYGFRGKKHTKEAIEVMRKLAKIRYDGGKNLTVFKKGCMLNIGEKNPMYGRVGEQCPAWKGGISNLPYAFDFNKELKELIKKRDGYVCQFLECGTDIDLMIHHADYNKQNSDPKNLITLCRRHNSTVNYNRDYWEKLFMAKRGDED